jgi:hypothetical protein
MLECKACEVMRNETYFFTSQCRDEHNYDNKRL